ncbi:Invasion protein IalB, involved in pathogenesis [Cognatiyoonia koreensis]|uniref:Invasion protein IalB, involved in pathogenesis n=1 Tax=Cognatiyoonia koreensis TaxID=364200 RepID=A0A1I0P015_9RHOB|nr:invasion associated locus B family protein [Cognatiyoonia koreensis]SEW07500.1 Invasion protein IalB, involved in pathogenesis [Cognatiyoonia koreensis]
MLNPMKPALLALMLSAGTTTFAQEATTETEAPAEEAQTDQTEAEEAPAADPTGDLSLGEPIETAQGEPTVGQPYILDTFDAWSLRCLKAAEGQADPCQLYQLLRDEQDNAVAEISMFPLPDGGRAAAGATIVVPLETLLTEQLTMSVDGSAARRYPFTFCNAAGCVARVGFTQDEVNQFKRGNSATLRLVPAAAPDEEVLLTVSLSGFTAALEKTLAPAE